MAQGLKLAGGLKSAAIGIVILILAALGYVGWQMGQGDENVTDASALSEYSTGPATTEPAPAAAPAPAPAAAPTAAPAVEEAAIDATPTLDVIRIAPDGEALAAGQGLADTIVHMLIDGVDFANATVDGAGAFVIMATLTPSDAPRRLSFEGEGPDGTRFPAAQTLIVAPIAGTQALAATLDGADAQAPLVLRADAEGVSILQRADGADAGMGVPLSIDTVSYGATGDVTVTGQGPAGAFLRVYLNDAQAGELGVQGDEGWRIALSDVAAGDYTLRVDQIALDGSVVARAETTFTREAAEVVEAATGGTDAIRVVTVERGFTLWGMAEQFLGTGFQYVQIFDANREQIRDPDLIYPGQVFTIPQP